MELGEFSTKKTLMEEFVFGVRDIGYRQGPISFLLANAETEGILQRMIDARIWQVNPSLADSLKVY